MWPASRWTLPCGARAALAYGKLGNSARALAGEGSGRPGPAEVKPGSLPVRLCATAKLRARAGQHRKAPPAAAATASTGAFAVSVFSKPAGLGAPCARKGCDNADT
jgi:hypothetical protein